MRGSHSRVGLPRRSYRAAPRRHLVCVALGVALSVALFAPASAVAVTPESPEVQRVIARGIDFLEKAGDHNAMGGKCLVGLALFKNGADPSHPRIAAAVEECKRKTKGDGPVSDDVYSIGLAIIFLCELDPSRYSTEIIRLLETLEVKQKSFGGWGYPDGHDHGKTGDTSMTQYGVLSAWEARQAGFDLSLDSIERVSNWLLRTQDPGGAWGYQGEDPGHYNLIKQGGVRHSMAAAGLGSALICAQMLGVVQFDDEKVEEGVPAVLRPVEEKAEGGKKGPVTDKVDPRLLLRAIDRGNRWMRANYQIDAGPWIQYYLYALERYMSFRELAEGKSPAEPKWYNDGFAYLKKTQKPNGAWNSKSGEAADTAFAVLFLLRSTKKSIEKSKSLGDGTLVGGRGLPRNLIDVKLRRGRVVGKGLEGTAADLISVLADPNHPDFDVLVENPSDLELSGDPKQRRGQIERLERLTRGGTPEARIVAVTALGRADNLDVAPTLIYALGDPDWRVVRAARNGLRFVSRKFSGFGLADRPTEDARLAAIEKWKAWLLVLRPETQFDE